MELTVRNELRFWRDMLYALLAFIILGITLCYTITASQTAWENQLMECSKTHSTSVCLHEFN